jgi:hypothetical protein
MRFVINVFPSLFGDLAPARIETAGPVAQKHAHQ